MRPPVVTVSCPACGGKVTDAELGDRTTCKYCGTELHLPALAHAGEAPSEQPVDEDEVPAGVPPPRVDQNRNIRAVVFAVAVLIVVAVFANTKLRGAGTSPIVDNPSQPTAVDPEMASVDCTLACNKPCMEIKEPEKLLGCMNACDDKCKYVGKGTPAECRARCGKTCAGAPDEGSRSACTTSCSAKCPP